MKKVCIVRHGYFPADVRVRKEAFALIDKGYHVDIICLRDKDEAKQENNGGVNVFRLPVKHIRGGMFRYLFEYFAFFYLAAVKLCVFHFKNKYDYIQVNTLPDFLVFVTLIPKLFGAKVVLDLHEPSPELWGTIFGQNRKLLIYIVKLVEQLSIKYAGKAITVSDQMKYNYIKRGAAPSKITVILNVPNLEFNFESFKNSARENDNKFKLICHGAMIKRYGQATVIKAIGILKNEIPNIHLDILGYGDYEENLKQLTSQLDLEDYVHFPGYLPFLDMIKMVSQTDIGIVPMEKNPYSDLVHTNKMFEYIAMKRPIIISRTDAVEDFFGSDDSCLKFFESGNEKDLARCVVELYNSPEKRLEMVENSYKKFDSIRWEITKEVYCRLFS